MDKSDSKLILEELVKVRKDMERMSYEIYHLNKMLRYYDDRDHEYRRWREREEYHRHMRMMGDYRGSPCPPF